MQRDKRPCDVCGALLSTLLYKQDFVTFDDMTGLHGYDVVCCSNCGFLFADGIPEQVTFDRYYREMSKYEPREIDVPMAPEKRQNFETIVGQIAERLPDRKIRILDVGSANGELLAVFRDAGYEDLTGFDPSPLCAEIARKRYGLRVIDTPISQMTFAGESFDLVVLSGVLEHVRDLGAALKDLSALVAPNGCIYFCVPDAERFIDYVEAPYQHFSLEHINFFTESSLRDLLDAVGMVPVKVWKSALRVGTMSEPDINALFRRGMAPRKPGPSGDGLVAIKRYIEASARLQDRIWLSLMPLTLEPRRPLIVWGTGSLTMHLLADDRFQGLEIVAFVDANRNYWHKTILGRPVLPPDAIKERSEVILIVSYAYESEILGQLRERFQAANTAIGLFSGHEVTAGPSGKGAA